MVKRIMLFSFCVLVIAVVFSGCDKDKDFHKTVDIISNVSSEIPKETPAQDAAVIPTLKRMFDDAKIPNDIQESDSDTLYVGLPCNIEITDKHLALFASYDNTQKKEIRDQIGWDKLITTIQTTYETVTGITDGTKYKHVVLHVYRDTDSSVTYLLLKDGKIQQDILAIN